MRRRTWRPPPAAAMLVLFETAAGYAIFKVSRGWGSGTRCLSPGESRPPTCDGAERRAKGSASGLRWELRRIIVGGGESEGGSEGSRIPCGASGGEQGRGWEQRGCIVSEASGRRLKVLGGQKGSSSVPAKHHL